MRPELTSPNQKSLIERELRAVRKLTPHPNILPFIGTCHHQNLILVSPLVRKGNLLQYLKCHVEVDPHELVRVSFSTGASDQLILSL